MIAHRHKNDFFLNTKSHSSSSIPVIIDDMQCGQSLTGMMHVAMNYSISITAEERTVERSKYWKISQAGLTEYQEELTSLSKLSKISPVT